MSIKKYEMNEELYRSDIFSYCEGKQYRLHLMRLMPMYTYGDPYYRTKRGLMRWRCMLDLKYMFLNVLHKGGQWGKVHDALMPDLEKYILYACYLGALKDGRIKKYPEKYRQQLSNYISKIDKKAMYLCYRGFFKTTLISIDMDTSMILVNPDIRIMVMSGSKGNSESIVGSIKSYFTENDLFRYLFPEYCPVPSMTGKITFGTLERFTVPNRRISGYREPTVFAVSPNTKLAGYHFDYHDHDDIIDEKNVNTEDTLKKAKSAYKLSLSLFDNTTKPFSTIIGTHYHSLDLYMDLKKEQCNGLGEYEYDTYNPIDDKIVKKKRRAS